MANPKTNTSPKSASVNTQAQATSVSKVSKPTPIWQSLLFKLKSNRLTQITLVGLFALAILVTLSVFFISRTRRQVGFTQPPLALPQASPQVETHFARDPVVLDAESSIATTEAQLKNLDLPNHPLLPPTLDLQVTLEE